MKKNQKLINLNMFFLIVMICILPLMFFCSEVIVTVIRMCRATTNCIPSNKSTVMCFVTKVRLLAINLITLIKKIENK